MSGGLPPGTGPIWIDSLSCSTGDVSILDCAYSLDNHDCTHHEDVVVSCFTGRRAERCRGPLNEEIERNLRGSRVKHDDGNKTERGNVLRAGIVTKLSVHINLRFSNFVTM